MHNGIKSAHGLVVNKWRDPRDVVGEIIFDCLCPLGVVHQAMGKAVSHNMGIGGQKSFAQFSFESIDD